MPFICSKYFNEFPAYLDKAKVSTLSHQDLHYPASPYFLNLSLTSLSCSPHLDYHSNSPSKGLLLASLFKNITVHAFSLLLS